MHTYMREATEAKNALTRLMADADNESMEFVALGARAAYENEMAEYRRWLATVEFWCGDDEAAALLGDQVGGRAFNAGVAHRWMHEHLKRAGVFLSLTHALEEM